MRNVEFHPAVRDEVFAQRDRFERYSMALGRRFVDEIDLDLERIQRNPERWPECGGGLRRFVMHRFAFSIIYRFDLGRVRVVAVRPIRHSPPARRKPAVQAVPKRRKSDGARAPQ